MAKFRTFDLALGRKLDTASVALFNDWAEKRISDEQYSAGLEALLEQAKRCPAIYANITSRMDARNGRKGRTIGEMAIQFGRAAVFEHRDTMRWFAKHMDTEEDGLDYNGMDSTGAVFFSLDRVNGAADWKIDVMGSPLMPDGEHLLEVKHNTSSRKSNNFKFSLKVADLFRYVQSDAWILVFFGSYDQDGNPPLDWALIPPSAIRKLLDRDYSNYDEFGGGKDAIRLEGAALLAFLMPLETGTLRD